MSRILSRLRYLFLMVAVAFPLSIAAEEAGLLDEAEEDAVTFEPSMVQQDDFDTNVNPVDESTLQGFDCMDEDGDGYLNMEELERRGECVQNAEERGLDTATRTALVLTRMDADRDRQVSRREFNIWNEMQAQQLD